MVSTNEHYQFLLAVPHEHAGEYLIPQFEITYRLSTGEEQANSGHASLHFCLTYRTLRILPLKTDYRYLMTPAIVVGALLFWRFLAVFSVF
jgi:hypothetical protein